MICWRVGNIIERFARNSDDVRLGNLKPGDALPSMEAELDDKLPCNSSWIYFPTVKLRTFVFLAIVLVGLLFSSCAARPRRAAISVPAPVGAAELTVTQSIIAAERCGRPLHRPMRPTFITIHSTANTSRIPHALPPARSPHNV